jgi:hypothetical protein
MQAGMWAPTDEVKKKLRALHPEATEPVPLPPKVAAAPISASRGELARLIKQRMNDGACSGYSGWNGALLQPLADDRQCMEGLAIIVRDILSGTLPPRARLLLVGCQLLAGMKDKISDGVRPLAPGEPLIKLAELYMLGLVEKVVPDVLGNTEYGVGAPGGSQRALHVINASYLVSKQEQHSPAIISTDFTNAFGTRSRARVLQELYSYPELSSLYRYAHWLLAGPMPMLAVWCGKLMSTVQACDGLVQGRVLSPLFFAVSMARAWRKVVDGLSHVKITTVLDDCTLVGDYNEDNEHNVWLAYDRLVEVVAEEKLILNPVKCRCLMSQTPASANNRDTWPHDERGLKQEIGAMELLGGMVGDDKSIIKEWVEKQALRHQDLFNIIKHPAMPKQIAALLLLWCARPSMDYIARVTLPSAARSGLQQFDKQVQEAHRVIIDHPPEAKEEIALIARPIAMGGDGLYSLVEISPAAYYASFAAAVPEIAADLLRLSDEHRASVVKRLELNDVFASLMRTCGEDPSILRDPADVEYWQHFTSTQPEKHQFRLCELLFKRAKQANAAKKVELRMLKQTARTAQLISLQQPMASQLLLCLPLADFPSWQLTNQEYLYAVRLRYGLQPLSAHALPETCRCGEKLLHQPTHWLWCKLMKRGAHLRRHNLIAAALKSFCSLLNCTAEGEIALPGSGKKPDLRIQFGSEIYWIDVQVVDPTAPSYWQPRRGADGKESKGRGKALPVLPVGLKEGGAALKGEAGKLSKYAKAVSALDGHNHLIPFVIEAHGSFGPSAIAFCKELAARHEEELPGLAKNVVFIRLVRHVTMALHRGNALAITEGLLDSVKAMYPAMRAAAEADSDDDGKEESERRKSVLVTPIGKGRRRVVAAAAAAEESEEESEWGLGGKEVEVVNKQEERKLTVNILNSPLPSARDLFAHNRPSSSAVGQHWLNSNVTIRRKAAGPIIHASLPSCLSSPYNDAGFGSPNPRTRLWGN